MTSCNMLILCHAMRHWMHLVWPGCSLITFFVIMGSQTLLFWIRTLHLFLPFGKNLPLCSRLNIRPQQPITPRLTAYLNIPTRPSRLIFTPMSPINRMTGSIICPSQSSHSIITSTSQPTCPPSLLTLDSTLPSNPTLLILSMFPLWPT